MRTSPQPNDPRPRMPSPLWQIYASLLIALLTVSATVSASKQQPLETPNAAPIRIALNDVPNKGLLPMLVALERARANGLKLQISYLTSENLVAQALDTGLVDIGMGTPYAAIEAGQLPVRMFAQLSKLAFYPVVNRGRYRRWEDLDGAEVYTHGAGSGTEALMNLMADRHDIRYRAMRYLPGSGTRARAMLQGRIQATMLDAERTNMLLEKAPRRFLVLPVDDISASDEALYARPAWIADHQQQLRILLNALLDVMEQTNQDPGWLEAQRQQLGLLPKLSGSNDPLGYSDPITDYIADMVDAQAWPADLGASPDNIQHDFQFYTAAGTLKTPVDQLQESDYWDLRLLRQLIAQRRDTSDENVNQNSTGIAN